MKNKLLFLFSMMFCMLFSLTARAQEDTEYEAALAAIGDGGNYFISTEADGVKYYVTAAGKLTSVRADGCIFSFEKIEGEFKPYGFKVKNGSSRFTNAPLNGTAVLDVSNFSTTTSNDRNTWEAQVFFLKDDKYAIRATNVAYGESGWADAGRVFWTWKVEDVNLIPQYTYEQVYQWQLEAATPITVTYKLVESDGITEVKSVAVTQESGSEVKIPASITSVFCYDYASTGTIGNEDCTITVTRTMKSGVVQDLAALSNSKAYTIRCDRGCFLTKNGYLASSAHGSLNGAEPTNFAIVNYEEHNYLYSVADKQFVTNNGALADMPSHGVLDAIHFDAKNNPYFLGYFQVDEGGTNYGINTNGNDPYGYVINTWMTADAGNQYYIMEAGDFDATEALKALNDYFHPSYFVTYVVKDAQGNVLLTSEPAPAAPGQKITTLPADYQRGFTTYNEVDVTITEQNTTVEFIATPNFPFEMSPSFADAKWYNMTIRGNYWVAMDESEPYYPKEDKDLDADASKWAFAGDAYNGVVIYNRAAGEGKTLTKDGNNVVMRDDEFKWEIFSNSDGFVMRPAEGEGMENMWVNQNGGSSGPLQFWNSGNGKTDNGSTFRIQEATPVYAINVAEAENGAVVADKAESKAGETIQLTITPAEGYELDALTVIAANGNVVPVSRTHTFEMPSAKVSVTATFKEQGDEESPKDITDKYLVNADLSTKDAGWGYYSDAYKYQAWETGNENEAAAVEFYAGWGSLDHTNFKFSQTITLPAGDYRIAVNAFYREGNDGNGTNADKAWIFAGEKKKNVVAMKSMGDLSAWSGENDMHKAMAAFKSGAFENAFDFSLAEETTIEVGFEGKFDAIRQWCILGPVQLWQYSLKDYLVAYNEKAIEVEELIKSGKKMGADELAALQASIVDESSFTLGSQVVAAIDVMNAAIEAANTSIVGYAKLTDAIEKGNDYKAHSEDAEAKATYDEAIADVKTAYDANTVADLAAALATVEAALPALAKTQTLEGSDMTVFITNPEINGESGWACEKPVGGNGPLLSGISFEYWAGNATDRATASFDYWQEISGLPKGVYCVSAEMFNSLNGEGGDYTEFAPTSGLYAASGSSEVVKLVDIDGADLLPHTTPQIFVLDGNLRIGVKNVTTPMAARWFVADNFKLTLVRPLAEDFDAEYEYALASIEDGKNYRIFSEVNGEKYYVTEAGSLTSAVDNGGIFSLTKVKGGAYKEYGYHISSGSKRFTNPPLANNVANLNPGTFATSTDSRADWEAQVLFLQDGKYAIRSCNVVDGTESWNDAGRTYWTWQVEDVEPVPQYTYDKAYQWQLELVTTITVTYELYESDGETKVSSVAKTQEANSEVKLPTEFTSVAYYDYTPEGTIGDEDCTIKVIRSMKDGLVRSLEDLSNAKAYTITCARGALLTKEGNLASNSHSTLTNAEAASFAIISYEDNYYLYSVADGKFVTNTGALADLPSHGVADAIKMEAKSDPYFLFYYQMNEDTQYGVNTNGTGVPWGVVINNWMTADAGNQYFMIATADFDATEALALLEKGEYLLPLNADLAANEPNPVLAGDGLFQKPQAAYDTFKAVYDAQKAVAENKDATIADLQAARTALSAAVETYAAVELNKPEEGQQYVFQNKVNGGYLSLNTEEGEVFAATDAQCFVFTETEDGYFLGNELGFIGIDGNNVIVTADENKALLIAAPKELTEDGVLYYTLHNNVEGGRYLNGNRNIDKKVTLITTAGDQALWSIVKYEVPEALELALNVERYPGMGYSTTEAEVNLDQAKAFLGVDELTTDMLRIVNPDGEEISDYAPFDGWFNAEGVATTWGDNTAINVKFFQAIPDGAYTICDMNGADEVGKTYSVKWALSANDKKVIYTINVTFVEKPAPVITNLSGVKVADTQTIELTSELGKCYEALSSDVDIASILSTLGVESISDLAIFAVGSDGTLDDNYKLGTTDGWRNASGDWQSWGDAAYFYVKADFTRESAQVYEVGGMEGKNTTSEWENPASYTASYVFVNLKSDDLAGVVLKVTLSYSVPVGINGLGADLSKATIYDLNGRKLNKVQKGGVYIVNGKKVTIK